MKYQNKEFDKRFTPKYNKNYLKTSRINPCIDVFEEHGLLYCNILVEGVKLKLILDTGSCYNLINIKSSKINNFENKPVITNFEFKAFHDNGTMPMIVCDLHIAGRKMLLPFGVLDLDHLIPGVDGLLGYVFLKDCCNSLDFRSNKLSIK